MRRRYALPHSFTGGARPRLPKEWTSSKVALQKARRNSRASRCKAGTGAPSFGEKGKPVLFKAGLRQVVERTNPWHNTYKEMVWCT